MEKREPGVDASPGDLALQQYPTPTVESTEPAFYQRDRPMEGHQEQDPAEPPTPPQRASRPDVNAEDLQLTASGDDQMQQLQLAAQMSQALSNVVGEGSGTTEEHFGHEDAGLQTLQQSLQADQGASLQGQESSLQQAQPETLSQSLPQGYQQDLQQNISHNLQQLLPHPAPPAPPQHAQEHQQQQQYMTSQPAPHLGPQAHGLPLNLAQPQYGGVGDLTTPPRKRSKVSRACDECRRKKIKCDFTNDPATEIEEACSNCKRTGIRCAFSRVPQKRGPSKGYIRELADRIDSIEGKLGRQGAAEALAGELAVLPGRESADLYSPTPVQSDDSSRKRPFSHISTDSFTNVHLNKQHTGWTPEQQRPLASQVSYPSSALGLKPILPREDDTTMARSAEAVDVSVHRLQSPQVRDVDDLPYHAYLTIIHHVLPFLPDSKAALDGFLAQCRGSLRNAFVEALNATLESFAVPELHGDFSKANQLLTEWEDAPHQDSSVEDLVALQTLLLLIIGADNHALNSLSGQHLGPKKPVLLGRATSRVYAMHLPQDTSTIDAQSDPNSELCIRVRAWWSLVLLDRWNAIATATPLFLSTDSVTLQPRLRDILGVPFHRFALLAYIMGQWVPASVNAPLDSRPGAAAAANVTFNANIELWRDQFPDNLPADAAPVLWLMYWHCRLLAFLFMPSALSTDIVWCVKESVRLLRDFNQMLSPLNHHFTALIALSLLELAKVEKHRDEANQLLKQLREDNIAPSAWDGCIRDKIAEATRPSTSTDADAAANQNLQRLADLATANTEAASAPAPQQKPEEEPKFRTSDSYEDLGFDPRPMLRAGYLHAVALSTP